MNRFEKMFVPGGLKVPRMIRKKGLLSAPRRFEPPKELILTGYCTPIENQGSKPWCAAYSAAAFAENVRWRRDGYYKEVDPAPVYAHAKTIDGDPDGDGTYLECALEGLKAGKVFGADCKVKQIGGTIFGFGDPLREVKHAIHKYGCALAGFDITGDWFNVGSKGVIDKCAGASQGGHAVLICGFDPGGVIIQNSWGPRWGHDGFAYVTNAVFNKKFMYASVLTGVFNEKKGN